jgi:hypothetical protein
MGGAGGVMPLEIHTSSSSLTSIRGIFCATQVIDRAVSEGNAIARH